MPVISNQGILSISLNTYKTELEDAFKIAFGNDIDLDPQTPQGQIIGIFALNMVQIDDAMVNAFQQLNIFTASGNQLDTFGALFEVSREEATQSTVIATLTGIPSTIIGVGSEAQTTSGDIFQATGNITLNAGGTGDGEFQAVETGAIAIDINTLTQIVTTVSGWETIDNSSAGDVGNEKESDINYRQDYFTELNKNAVATVEAIRSRVAAVDNVEEAEVFENDTDNNLVIQNVTLLPHSIAVIVEGGLAQEIGQAIYDPKTVGANTAGDDLGIQTAVIVPTNEALNTITIYFYPVVFVTLEINITVVLFDDVPDVVTRIQDAIIDFFDGTFSNDIPAIGIADSSYRSRLYTPINSIGGFDTTVLTQEILGSGTPEEIIEPDLNERLVVDASNINVTVL